MEENRSHNGTGVLPGRTRVRPGAKNAPGVFQLWWFDAANGAVLLGWRAPEAIANVIGLNNLATLTAGTLDTKAAEEKPAEPPQNFLPSGADNAEK